MPIEPPISWPVVLRPESMPVFVPGPGHDGHRDADEHDAESDPCDEHPRQDIAEVAAVGADGRQHQHPAGRGCEADGHRHTDPCVSEHVVSDMHPAGQRDSQRQEREPGLQWPGAQDVLHVEGDEQEGAEQRGGRGEHHQEAAAHRAVGQPLDPKQRVRSAQLDDCEREQAGESGTADGDGLRRGPADVSGLREGENQRSEAAGGQCSAAQVEPAPARS